VSDIIVNIVILVYKLYVKRHFETRLWPLSLLYLTHLAWPVYWLSPSN